MGAYKVLYSNNNNDNNDIIMLMVPMLCDADVAQQCCYRVWLSHVMKGGCVCGNSYITLLLWTVTCTWLCVLYVELFLCLQRLR